MNSFDTIDELWIDAASWALAGSPTGSRDGASKEHLGYVARLMDPRACFLFNPVRRLSPSYAAAELIWYLSGEDDITRVVAYAPRYERFANEGRAHGAYGKRWADDLAYLQVIDELDCIQHDRNAPNAVEREALRRPSDVATMERVAGRTGGSQLWTVVKLLREKPDTRQAVMTCWNAGDCIYALAGTKNDLPCTLSLQFLLRDGRLNMVVTMRSNDVHLGLPYDVFCFCHIQMIVATALRVPLGWYQHQVGSLHVYDRDDSKVRSAVLDLPKNGFDSGPLDYMPHVGYVEEKVLDLVRLEEWNRKNTVYSSGSDGTLGGPATLFNQVLLMATSKWSDRVVKDVTTPLLRKYMEKQLAHS